MFYPDVSYEIDNKLIESYEIFEIKIFGSIEHFHVINSITPQWVAEAGISSNCPVGKNMFQKFYECSPENEILNRMIYYYDCDNLISSLQNVVIESFYLSSNIEKILAKTIHLSDAADKHLSNFTGHRFLCGEVVVGLFTLTNMLFINLYSQLDYITKLFYEMQNVCKNFAKYPRMRSFNILYGDKGKLRISNPDNTVFNKDSETIKTIINFRNEIIHNGTLDGLHKLFQKYENGKITEQFILLPDTTNGNLDKIKSRSHFYGTENRWEDIVPVLLDDFYLRLKNTLDLILSSQTRNV